MTEADITTAVPAECLDLAYELLDVIESHNSFVTVDRRYPDDLLDSVVASPTFFATQGGRFGHDQFQQKYGPLLPQLTLFAAALTEGVHDRRRTEDACC